MRVRPAGRFFGATQRRARTPSFLVAEMDAVIPPDEVPRHCHEAPHFVLVLRGAYATEARNQEGPCAPGTLIFNPAGTTHRDRFHALPGRFLTITPRGAVCALLAGSESVPLVVSPTSLAAGIRDELWRGDRTSGLALESLGLELIAAVGRLPAEPSRHVPPWLVRARALIDDALDAPPELGAIAATVGVHPVHLARAFRRHFACSPGQWLRHRRAAHVRQLLVGTTLSLAEIAQRCGFADQSQMTKAFRAVFGAPPGRYRRQVQT